MVRLILGKLKKTSQRLNLQKNSRNIFLLLILGGIFLISVSISPFFYSNEKIIENKQNNVRQQIVNQAVSLDKSVGEMVEILKDNPTRFKYSKIDSLLTSNNELCFILENDEIFYWNNSKISPYDIDFKGYKEGVSVVKLPTGWFLLKKHTSSDLIITLLTKIKPEYSIKNNFLQDHGEGEFIIPEYFDVSGEKSNLESDAVNLNGEFLCNLSINETTFVYDDNYLILASYIIGVLFIVLFTLFSKKENSTTREIMIRYSIASLILAIFWILIQVGEMPFAIASMSIFHDQAMIGISKGILIISSVFLLIFSIISYWTLQRIKDIELGTIETTIFYIIQTLYILFSLYIVWKSSFILDNRILETTFNKSSNIIFDITILMIINLGIYFLLRLSLSGSVKNNSPIIIPVIVQIITIVVISLLLEIPILILSIVLVLTITLVIMKYYFWNSISDNLIKNLVVIIILSGVSSLIVNITLSDETDKYQKYIASVLSKDKDIVLEERLNPTLEKISRDTFLNKVFQTDSVGDAVDKYLRNKYFVDDFDWYDIQVTACDPNELIEIQPNKEVFGCQQYFDNLISEFTMETSSPFLNIFNSSGEGYYYIAKLEKTGFNIYIEIISSHVPEGLGYPELLVDNESQVLNLTDFSFAIYEDDILVYKFGDFAYKTAFSSNADINFNHFHNQEGYRHLAEQKNENSVLIVSRKITPLTLRGFLFSFIFLLLTIITLVVYFLTSAKRALDLFRMNYKTRLQTFVISALTITFSLITVSTLLFIQENTKQEMEKQLLEKTNSVLIELQHKLSDVKDLNNEDREVLYSLLRKFSLVFFSDINLYNDGGELIATSRPEIFEKNLLSPLINPKAYVAIFDDNKLNYITEESIGSMDYYSSYVPINLSSYKPIGIVNLPYFARQSEYTRSYYIMFSYLINIYVLIGIITTIIAVIFSRYLTRPLALLQKSISGIRIDKQNERIEWNKNDEIGILISEYNRMVDKLEQSADLLVRSERESAWREVAKQIAHEIKNPLTPMKLNVQYLEKAYKNNDPGFATKLESVSSSLITQIDTLNNVAEMFSDFAKNSSSTYEKTDLKKILTTSVQLFDKRPNLSINVNFKVDGENMVMGNEKDILRVVNNILKNAVQATDGLDGIIDIQITDDGNYSVVTITDNGKGIPDNSKSSIFQPYFTTKSSGTGLGLAIVKNIINEVGGEVSFVSREGKGTTFTIKLRKVKP